MKETTYTISTRTYSVLHDEVQRPEFYDLDYHLELGDYLGVLATILGFCIDAGRQEQGNGADDYRLQLLEKTRRDLAALHATHTIVPRKQDNE